MSPDSIGVANESGTMPLRVNKTTIRSGIYEQEESFTHKMEKTELSATPVAADVILVQNTTQEAHHNHAKSTDTASFVKNENTIIDSSNNDKTQANTFASQSLIRSHANLPVPGHVE